MVLANDLMIYVYHIMSHTFYNWNIFIALNAHISLLNVRLVTMYRHTTYSVIICQRPMKIIFVPAEHWAWAQMGLFCLDLAVAYGMFIIIRILYLLQLLYM